METSGVLMMCLVSAILLATDVTRSMTVLMALMRGTAPQVYA